MITDPWPGSESTHGKRSLKNHSDGDQLRAGGE